MAILGILVGLSASGKSTMADRLKSKGYKIVSSDAIREELSFYEDQSRNNEVFKIFHKRIGDYLANGENVVADATNLTIKSRKSIIDIGKKYNANIKCIIVASHINECIARDKTREHSVGMEVIRRQALRFEVPFYEEGFDDIFVSNENNTNPYEIMKYFNLMVGFDQCNPYHSHDLDLHCKLVANNVMNNSEFYKSVGHKHRLAIFDGCMIHDIGKTFTQKFDENGVAHYYNHSNIGAYYMLNEWCRNGLIDRYILIRLFIINYHMRPFDWNTPKAIQKAKNRYGEKNFQMLMEINEADINA